MRACILAVGEDEGERLFGEDERVFSGVAHVFPEVTRGFAEVEVQAA